MQVSHLKERFVSHICYLFLGQVFDFSLLYLLPNFFKILRSYLLGSQLNLLNILFCCLNLNVVTLNCSFLVLAFSLHGLHSILVELDVLVGNLNVFGNHVIVPSQLVDLLALNRVVQIGFIVLYNGLNSRICI